jgi:uncharacterized protein (TIGR02118 family)
MIKVTVLYPNNPGSTFDMAYYLDKHIPMVQQKLSNALRGTAVDQGLGGTEPGSPPAYVVICHFLFDSVDAYQEAFRPHAQAIVDDVPNYTNTPPIVQVSAVRL